MVIFKNRVVIQEFLSAQYSVDSLGAFSKPSVVLYLFISIIYVTGIILFNLFQWSANKSHLLFLNQHLCLPLLSYVNNGMPPAKAAD